MKILIGTPIHICKDYAMERWLKCVSGIRVSKKNNWRLFMVDNSGNNKYHQKVKKYCAKLNFQNYEIIHLAKMNDSEEHKIDRLGTSREEIRQKLLTQDWDFWLSWECDILCPPNVLTTLLSFTKTFDIVGHTYPLRGISPTNKFIVSYMELESMGIMLFPKKFFINYGFTKGPRHNQGDGPLLNEIITNGWKWVSLHNYLKTEHIKDI